MVCTGCGYENPSSHRYCGMCGTPLPHAPLTAPGAHSTLTFTRTPLDGPASSNTATSGTGVIEIPASEPYAGESSHSKELADSSSVSTLAAPEASVSVEEQQAHEMVPEIPLDAYIREFHYVPPSEPEEVDMRGEAAPVEHEAPAPDQSAVAPAETPIATDEIPPESGDVQERLGLDSDEPSIDEPERPRFLDINQPLTPPHQSPSPSPTIAGPSFLEVTDLPQASAPEAGASPPRRWGTWLAAALVLMFTALGVAEWRARVSQNHTGPVGIIVSKIRSLRHPGQAGTSDNQAAPATASSDSDAAKVAAAVVVPPKPQDQGLPTTAVNSPLSANASAGKQPTTTQNSGTSENQDGAKPAAAQTAAERPMPDVRSAQGNTREVPGKETVPGSEEMTKATNASDKAAEAAWLWKATAKGNPVAPVQLADLYVKGEGVPRSCEQAVVLLKTAAEKENAPARNRLAAMYSTGTCVQPNRVQAYHWLTSALAADPNSQWAQQNRDQIWQQMTPEERAQVEKNR